MVVGGGGVDLYSGKYGTLIEWLVLQTCTSSKISSDTCVV